MEYCSCAVDLSYAADLGRAGYIDKPKEFIKKMPIKADASIRVCF